MRRLPVLLSAAALYLSACDFFSTRELRPKPTEIRVLPGLERVGDSVAFLATEAVWRAGATGPEQVLSKRRVTFVLRKDSADDPDTLKFLTMRIREDSSGVLLEESQRLVRFTATGVVLSGAEDGSARLYPIKAAAGSADPASAAAPSDSDAFLALPTLLIEGWSESVSMGVFTVQRTQSAVDTVDYRGHSEETWVISESVLDGSVAAGSGKYWYGASGLLKAEQAWEDFDWRDGNGAPAGAKDGSAPAVSLRRSVVRL
jgi:hypothetical protein